MKMKMAITGKGGVGKTTFAAMISRIYAEEGYKVLAVDADPDPNLALALGFPQKITEEIVPISEMKKLVAERTNSTPGAFGKMFKINPKVDDIPERYCKEYNGVRLLTMGTVDTGGTGCFCPENVLLKKLTSHLLLQNKDIVIMDMEAGIEHLGRGTAQGVDVFIVVIEPGIRSIQTFKHVRKLAKDIGIKKIFAVANKIKNEEDKQFVLQNIDEKECLGFIHYSRAVGSSDRVNRSPYDSDNEAVEEVKKIKERLELGVF
ncbi:protochlorophyllide reductase iron-sulfur ATP-binding protein [Clostridium luticellarii]|jgi:CO dehydrogenase maturation factor|uniref:Protochlorophyllide reductase iron-sulfur ATP-binding protein n=2 Tax=Clostridium luticellarii TaxID=1691940 RepID=A0A2T0BSV7_9CLOT|nr:protochlorophyllide reductase iron-sulfur ATP-binding protein [Clostridium luticellarii]